MKKIYLLVLATLLGTGALFSQNYENTIETSVSLNKEVTPDEIFLSITINEKDNKGKASVDTQEKQMIKTLASLGIDTKEALTVNNMGSSLKENTLRKDNIFISKNYTLKVSTAKMASDALQALKGIDISKCGIQKISISDSLEREVKNQLLAEAAKKAKENAGILAQAVGAKVGKPVYMQNYYTFNSASNGRLMTVAYSASKSADSAAVEESVELEVTKKNLNITVNCKFILE